MKKNIIKIITLFSFLLISIISLTSCFNMCKHEYVESSRVDATCEKEGYIIKVCSLCDKETKQTIAKIPHEYVEEKVLPTCTEEGYTLKVCKNCDHEEITNYVSELGHDFGSWETIIEATELSDGLKRRTCTVCSHQEEEVISSISYINLDIIKESFDASIQYKCSSYEELLLKFNCALLRNSPTLKCEIDFEYISLQDLLTIIIIPYFYIKINVLEPIYSAHASPQYITSEYVPLNQMGIFLLLREFYPIHYLVLDEQ